MPLTQQHTKTYNSFKICITTIPEIQLMKITFYHRNKLHIFLFISITFISIPSLSFGENLSIS